MTCRRHQDAILDLARGVPLPAAVAEAARAHARACGDCAAALARQRDLTRAFTALSAAAEKHAAPPALEARLLAVFPAGGRTAGAGGYGRGSKWWLAAAAAIALVAAGLWTWRDSATPVGVVTTAPAGVPSAPLPSRPERTERAAAGPGSSVPSGATARPVAARPEPRRPRQARPVRDVEFITIPAAAGLPPIESATIVRTELPLSALPEYGVQILPHAARAAIEADLLVGQDGVPRGIRLVSASDGPAASRSRAQ